MPKLFHKIPISDNTTFDRVDHFMSSVEIPCHFANLKIQSVTCFAIAASPTSALPLVSCFCDQSWDVKGRLGVAGIAHLRVACAVVDDDHLAVKIHLKICNIYNIKVYLL